MQRRKAAKHDAPHGNHGDNKRITIATMSNPQQPTLPDRIRLSVEVSPVVSSHLDHISDITGQSKASIVSGVLLAALPDLLTKADGLKRRYQELNQAKKK
jgi:hypothetical protein